MLTTRSERPQWEVVWAGDGEVLASIVAGGLEADGFSTQTVGNHAAHGARGIVSPFGSWAVLVPSTVATEARVSLAASGDGANVVRPGVAGTPADNLRIIVRLTLFALPVLLIVALLAWIRQEA